MVSSGGGSVGCVVVVGSAGATNGTQSNGNLGLETVPCAGVGGPSHTANVSDANLAFCAARMNEKRLRLQMLQDHSRSTKLSTKQLNSPTFASRGA